MKNLNFTGRKGRYALTAWRFVSWGMALSFLLYVCGCSVQPALDDVQAPAVPRAPQTGAITPVLSVLPTNVTLDRIDLYLEKGTATTGTITVEVRNAANTTVLGAATVTASSLVAGGAWRTFNFAPTLILTRTQVYRINLIRSNPHNYGANDYIFWRTSSGGVDAYPDGISNYYPSWILDYAFKTYNGTAIDQQQTSTNYGFAVGNTSALWQEFKADYPKVTLAYTDLYLDTGTGATGSVVLEVRDETGATVLGQTSILCSSLVGAGWRKFKLGVTLYRDQPYRLYVTRTDAHNYATNNYVFWRTSSGGVNSYPDGINDVYPSWTLDYAFRTYAGSGVIDQQQTLTTYGFFTSSGLYRWQGFIPRVQ